MNVMKKYANRIFIDGLSGMATGLFATLIIGTIIQRIGLIVGGLPGTYIEYTGKIASLLTGAGIGCGVAYKFKESPLVTVSAATCGMIGAFASQILAGTVFAEANLVLKAPGEPLGAFVAAYIGIECGHLISGKTKLDIILTPLAVICTGAVAGLLAGPPISKFMLQIGAIINWAANEQPFIMGIVISVVMGMVLTLPISSAALGVILNLSGIAAGAATVGCCANMVGFAVASYRENKLGGLFAQGIGTSMLQVPNIVRKPAIWLPAILTSAVLGPVATKLIVMTNNAVGSGMGTSGLVGQFTTYETMIATESLAVVLVKIAVMHFILPGILAFGISEFMRKKGWIKEGDMKLDI